MVKLLNEAFALALRQLRTRKVRTLLVLLGISIGVAAVVGVTSLGEGIRVNAVDGIRQSRDLTILEVSPGLSSENIILITGSKVRAIREYGYAAAPYVRDAYVTQDKTYFEVNGISAEYRDARDLQLEDGVWFEEGTYQIVLGSDIGEKLSRIERAEIGNSLNASIRLYGEEGRGVDRAVTFMIRGRLAPTGTQADDQAFIDITVAEKLAEKEVYDGIIVKVDTSSQAPAARAEIERLDLTCFSAQDEIDAINRIMNGVTLVLGFFSGISLIVGGVMIVNTMIISVYERTREIGIAKSIGASESDIIRMFLSECIITGILGGILGDVAGVAFSFLIDRAGRPLLVTQLGIGDIDRLTVINTEILAAGFLISLIISVLSGIYPAWRAAKLDPVKALRQL